MSPRSAPLDQAHGLRQLFAAQRQRFVPLVHNRHVAFGGVAMERLCAAFAEAQLHTLVVDAAESASAAHELALVDLSACIEPLSPSVSYLAARGLPMRHLDARGSTSAFLGALAEAAPRADVVLVHAGATDLARLFARRLPRPILQAADAPESLTHAYASMKLLTQRLGVMTFDLMLAADGASPRVPRIAERLAECADRFLGAVITDWALADPLADEREPLSPALCRLAMSQLRGGDEQPETSAGAPYARVDAARRDAAARRVN
ncbi:MAG: flagellar biosynthesis protein [Burkholderiales bacterium]|nr:flagellar biosynthesis protein [Burkholderiales bacterium]